jgi:hypothetical protein
MDCSQFDEQLNCYMPAIPEPFYGRLKWWHLRTHCVCAECWAGFRNKSAYVLHYALNHIAPASEDIR